MSKEKVVVDVALRNRLNPDNYEPGCMYVGCKFSNFNVKPTNCTMVSIRADHEDMCENMRCYKPKRKKRYEWVITVPDGVKIIFDYSNNRGGHKSSLEELERCCANSLTIAHQLGIKCEKREARSER